MLFVRLNQPVCGFEMFFNENRARDEKLAHLPNHKMDFKLDSESYKVLKQHTGNKKNF